MKQKRVRRGPERPRLLNPYAVEGRTRGSRSSSVAVGAAVLGAAGLVVLGGGVAAADDGDDGDTDGVLSSASLEPADTSFGSEDSAIEAVPDLFGDDDEPFPVDQPLADLGVEGIGTSPWPAEAPVPVFSPADEQALTEAAVSDDLLQPPDGVESSVGTSTPADVVRIASAPSVEDADVPPDAVDADRLDARIPEVGDDEVEDEVPAGVVPYSTTAGSSAGLPSGMSGEDSSTTRASALAGAAETVAMVASGDVSPRSAAGSAADPVSGAAARPAVPGEPTPTDDGSRTDRRESLLGATEVVSDTPTDLGISSVPGRSVLLASLPARPLGGEPVDPESVFDPAQRGMIDFAQGSGADFLDLVLNTEYENTSQVGEALRRFVNTYPEYLECPVQISCVTMTSPPDSLTNATDGVTTIVPGTVTIGREERNPFGVRDPRNRVPADSTGVGIVTVKPPAFDMIENDGVNIPEVNNDDFVGLSRLAYLFPDVPVTGTIVNGFTGDTLEFDVPRLETALGPIAGAPDRYELTNPLGLPVADRIKILDRTYDTVNPLTTDFQIDLPPGTRVDPPGTAWNAYRSTAILNADADEDVLQAQRDAAAALALADLQLLAPTAPEETIQQALDHVTFGWSHLDDFTPYWQMTFPDPWDAEDSEQEPGQPPFPSQTLAPLLPGTQIRGLLPAARDVVDGGTSVDTADPGVDEEAPEAAEAVGQGGQVVVPERPQVSGLEPGMDSPQSAGVPMRPPGLVPPRTERWELPPLEEPVAPRLPGHTGQRREDAGIEMPATRFPPASERDRPPTRPERSVQASPAGVRPVGSVSSGRVVPAGAGRVSEPVVAGSVARVESQGSGSGSGSNVVQDFLSGPATIQRLPDGGYRAVGGLGGHLGWGYVAVYDRWGNLVSPEQGTAPSKINIGQYMDPVTGALVGAAAALPLLAPQVGTGGLGLGGSTVAAGLLPVLPGVLPDAGLARDAGRGAGTVGAEPVTRLGRPVCSPALSQGCVRSGSWDPGDRNSVGVWVAGPAVVGRGVPGHPDYERLVAEGKAGNQAVKGMPGYGKDKGVGVVGQRFVGDGSGTPQDQVGTAVKNVLSGYTVNQAVEQVGRRWNEGVQRDGMLTTVLKAATGGLR